jgi:pimeloyl-ACP methyl ester carboxylesterase
MLSATTFATNQNQGTTMSTIQTIAGLDVHLDGHGEPLLLMVHGWPDTHDIWNAQIPAFAPHYRCARFTLPNYATRGTHQAYSIDAIAELINQVVDALSPNRPIVLMIHDWGCAFGYQFYRLYPHKVAQIVSLDIGDAMSRAHIKELKAYQMAMIATYQLSLATTWLMPETLGTGVARGFAKLLQHHNPSQVHRGMSYPYFMAWFKALSHPIKPFSDVPTCPMLFLYAKHKPLMFHSKHWLGKVAAQNGNQVMGMKAGHWIMREIPQEFNQTVAAWLQSTRPTALSDQD